MSGQRKKKRHNRERKCENETGKKKEHGKKRREEKEKKKEKSQDYMSQLMTSRMLLIGIGPRMAAILPLSYETRCGDGFTV